MTVPVVSPDKKSVRGEDSEPWLKRVGATGTWERSMTTLVETRGFSFRTGEPVAVGGNDAHPTPMQYVVGAVNGCVTVVIEAVAKELDITVESIETRSQAQQDVRGFRGTADVSPHFLDFTLTVTVRTPVPEVDLDSFKVQVERRCPAINLIRDAGVDFELVWHVVGARA